MRTTNINISTESILKLTESLLNQIQNLQPGTETESKLKKILSEISNGIVSDLLILQDFLQSGNEISELELMTMLTDYEVIIN